VLRALAVASAIVVLCAGVVIATSRKPDAPRYARSEVVQAFAEQGFELGNFTRVDGRTFYEKGRWIMGPKRSRDGDFVVYVLKSASEARAQSVSYVRLGLAPPRFAVLQGNVYVESIDPGLSTRARGRLRKAMFALDDLKGL
jgi:hypothetical protein